MRTLDQEQDIVDLANKLGLTGSPVDTILNYCQRKVDGWVAEKGTVESITQLEALIKDRLGLMIEEVQSDEDLIDLKERYVRLGEPVFKHIVENDLTPDTFGTMVRLRNGAHVAVIDSRGEKAARRFFTRWHEIAHLLVDPECERQVFRSNDEPLERLMDQIAGHIGFYDSLFSPILQEHSTQSEYLTFGVVEQIRSTFCPHASFQATLNACHRRWPNPILYIEAEMAFSESERRSQNQKRLFDDDMPEMKLRVKVSVPNKPATESKLTARWNMRIPESSIVSQAFLNDQSEAVGFENLKSWTFSKGGFLLDLDVHVQARRINKIVMATLQPTRASNP